MTKASQLPRLVLYHAEASPPSCAVRMLGHILDLDFHYKQPKLLQLEHKTPQFKKINPMGTIPVLQDGDFIVSERFPRTADWMNRMSQEDFYKKITEPGMDLLKKMLYKRWESNIN